MHGTVWTKHTVMPAINNGNCNNDGGERGNSGFQADLPGFKRKFFKGLSKTRIDEYGRINCNAPI